MKRLPIGISSFSEIRHHDYAYVDKTGYLLRMLEGKYYFLSRPRRFGKSLLVDTLKEMLSGNRELFHGLKAYDQWDWTQTYPVIHISLAGELVESRAQLRSQLLNILHHNARRLGVTIEPAPYHDPNNPNHVLQTLMSQTHQQYDTQVAVLIDEYDKPLLDNVNSPLGEDIQKELRNFYSVLKDNDTYVRLVFLTGVSKFSHVSVFSGLNNLLDITLDPTYHTICGYTQIELETVFAKHLQGVDLVQVRQWYNGFSWGGETVYNPFDILLFLQQDKEFRPYWFHTATPTFLVELMQSGQYFLPEFEDYLAQFNDFNGIELGKLKLAPLLFQTGYLTVKKAINSTSGMSYHLGFPNIEVRSAFTQLVLNDYLHIDPPNTAVIQNALRMEDIEGIRHCFTTLFAGIANDNYRNNPISHYEGHYASVVYGYLASLGFVLIPEDVTRTGRIDLTIKLTNNSGKNLVYIFEFKVISTAADRGRALKQIMNKNYPDKYRQPGTTIHLIGMEFCPTEKNLVSFTHETLTSGD